MINKRRTRVIDEDPVDLVVARIHHKIADAPDEYAVRCVDLQADEISGFFKHRYQPTSERIYHLP